MTTTINPVGCTRSIITSRGEIAHGLEDFKMGTSTLRAWTLLPTIPVPKPYLIPAYYLTNFKQNVESSKFMILNNWLPLVDAVKEWKQWLSKYPHLSSIYLLDCGAEGDCLFHAIAAGYNQLFKNWIFSMFSIREIAANQLHVSFIDDFLLDWNVGIRNTWNSTHITKEEQVKRMKTIIKTPGNTYWGTHATLLYLLLHAPQFTIYKVGFAVLEYDALHTKSFRTQIFRLPDTTWLLTLYCINDFHWLLVGYAPTGTDIASTFPIDYYPEPLFPFLQDQKL